MRQLNEIKNVIDKHNYSINIIICDVMKKFKFKTICHNSGASSVKEDGYSVSEIITLLVMFPLMLLNTVNSFYKSEYNNISEMKKDVIYRLKNNEKMPWRKLLYGVCKRFQQLVNPEGIVDHKSAFILDDTADKRTGCKIENISIIHNHGSGIKGNSLGFKKLVLGFFDGKSISPLDFSIHSEKKLSLKQRKKQYKKECTKNSNGSRRRRECTEQKNTNGLAMIISFHRYRIKLYCYDGSIFYPLDNYADISIICLMPIFLLCRYFSFAILEALNSSMPPKTNRHNLF